MNFNGGGLTPYDLWRSIERRSMEKLKVGVIGLGQRGYSLLRDVFIKHDGIVVSAVCDIYEDRVDKAASLIEEANGKIPFKSLCYEELITKSKVDCIVVCASWDKHVEMVIKCLEAGIPCGCEVGGAESVEECFELVRTYERTKTPFMFMENCCYGRREMMVLNMARQGVLGEIVHCSGGYHHDLRYEVTHGREHRHYRLNEYLTRNCENYPTHEIGPIAQVLDINRGNRFVSLCSTASKSVGMHEYILENKADDKELVNAKFTQADVVTTVIKCERGETIVITLDTSLPRFYSRGFTVQGTKGMYEESTDSVFLECDMGGEEHWDWKPNWGNASKYAEKYEHEMWKKYIEDGVKQGHGGMDYLVYNEFFEHVKSGEPMPIDVYDAATWMCITPLSEMSIKAGGVSVEVPDFKKMI